MVTQNPDVEPSTEDVRRAIDERLTTRRVSHADLMRATEALRAAYDKEMAAGNKARAFEINQIILMCFQAAIRVEDIPLPEQFR